MNPENQNLLLQISHNKNLRKPVIYGISGKVLLDSEKEFFLKNSCLGFILFSRNIDNKFQLKKLTNSLRELMGGEVLILVDQEGGRVARLCPPNFKSYPSAEFFSEFYEQNKIQAELSLFDNFCDLGRELKEVGINTNCAPVLDVLTPETHKIIGDRSFGKNPYQVSKLGKVVCDALLSQGIFPVIKHIPGHGRARCDSHFELPVVEASLDELKSQDFIPFTNLKDQKFAMTAHILFRAIDEEKCVTFSKKSISLIRDQIGFKNILMSDDLSMKALSGSYTDRAINVLNAGCDLILHCNGIIDEMQEINLGLPNISENFWEKFVK